MSANDVERVRVARVLRTRGIRGDTGRRRRSTEGDRMGWQELPPPASGGSAERVTIGRTRHGSVILGVSAPVARRNGLTGAKACRVLVSTDGPRQLRVIPDETGPFRVTLRKGGGVTISCGRVDGAPTSKSRAEFDECVDEKGRKCLDVDLPAPVKALPAPVAEASKAPRPVRHINGRMVTL